jgi:hypothetical protein
LCSTNFISSIPIFRTSSFLVLTGFRPVHFWGKKLTPWEHLSCRARFNKIQWESMMLLKSNRWPCMKRITVSVVISSVTFSWNCVYIIHLCPFILQPHLGNNIRGPKDFACSTSSQSGGFDFTPGYVRGTPSRVSLTRLITIQLLK